MMIVNQTAPDGNLTHLTINLVLWLDQTHLNRRGVGDNLEGRAGLVDTLQRPVGPSLGRFFGWLVRINRRYVRQRQNLAGLRIHHDRRAGFCVSTLDRRAESLL